MNAKILIVGVGALALCATAASADEIVQKRTDYGTYSSPTGAGTPTARANSGSDVPHVWKREQTTTTDVETTGTVVERPASGTTVIERRAPD